MDTEGLNQLRNLLPPQQVAPCNCQLCATSDNGCQPADAKTLLLTAGELRAALEKMPSSAPVVAELYLRDHPHVALIRCVYRDQDAPTVVLIATEETSNKNHYV